VQPSIRAVPLPDNVHFSLAAGLGVPALTAHRCVFADGPVAGKTVLVPGGAGAVGNVALQMARIGGAANIISTVSGDAKAEIARQAGAHHTVNYRTEDTAARILELTDGAGVDLIVEVDYSGNFAVSQQIIKRSGSIAIYAAGDGPAPPFQFPVSNVNVRHVLVYDMPEEAKTTGVEDTNRWLSSGELVGMDGPHFPLEDTAGAHEAVRAATVGKVVIDVSDGG
jgi:NADPH2:quinone reductase